MKSATAPADSQDRRAHESHHVPLDPKVRLLGEERLSEEKIFFLPSLNFLHLIHVLGCTLFFSVPATPFSLNGEKKGGYQSSRKTPLINTSNCFPESKGCNTSHSFQSLLPVKQLQGGERNPWLPTKTFQGPLPLFPSSFRQMLR